MSTALVEHDPQPVTADQLDLVKKTVAQGATDAELKLYLYDCQRQGVHPLDRLLHFTKRGNKYTPVTSIDLMRIRAAETNEYAGSDDASFYGMAATDAFAATVTVWRLVQGTRCAFTATARWAEYYPGDQGGHMWRKMPHTMLGKCAEALALRKGFPRQLAGLYAKEELDQSEKPEPPRHLVEHVVTKILSDVPPPATPPAAQVRPETPPTPDEIKALPSGAVYLLNIVPAIDPAVAEITTHAGEVVPVFNETLATIAKQSIKERTPVELEFAQGEKGAYVKKIKRLTKPMAAGEIPF